LVTNAPGKHSTGFLGKYTRATRTPGLMGGLVRGAGAFILRSKNDYYRRQII
jgi:hypothetical protein